MWKKPDSDPAPLRVSAVLPCFEEAGHLSMIVADLQQALRAAAPAGFEILLVCSLAAGDGTPALAQELSASTGGVRVVNQQADDPGYGRAVSLGISQARYPWLLLTDADGQFEPAELSRLVESTGCARAVVGYRTTRQDAWPRRIAGLIYSLAVTRLAGIRGVRDLDCAFKLVHTETLGSAPLNCRTGVINAEILMRAFKQGARVVEVPVSHRPRRGGRTRFETRLGPFKHLPRLEEMAAMLKDLVRLRAGR